jgi:hypothetical protein
VIALIAVALLDNFYPVAVLGNVSLILPHGLVQLPDPTINVDVKHEQTDRHENES